jgi:hypothetical protein
MGSRHRCATRVAPDPDFLLGEVFSTTSRGMLVADTGLGKTNFALAMAAAKAEGRDFLHWRGRGRSARVLIVEGEMSRRLVKRRLSDMSRRAGGIPPTLYVVSRSDPRFADMPPLNTPVGQQYIDNLIRRLGGVDFVIFDNIQALMIGDMKDELPWQDTLPWIRDLTNRSIGQLWIHHTGHDTRHAYGTKTREWQLDTVALMEKVERPDADIAFSLSFPKARERSPDNRADFKAAIITLTGDEWVSERGNIRRGGKRPARERVLEILIDTISRHGEVPPANPYIPPETPCVSEDLWRRSCEAGSISEGNDEATSKAIRRAQKALLDAGRIGMHKPWVWVIH